MLCRLTAIHLPYHGLLFFPPTKWKMPVGGQLGTWQRGTRKCTSNWVKVDLWRFRVWDPKGPSTNWLKTLRGMTANRGQYESCCGFFCRIKRIEGICVCIIRPFHVLATTVFFSFPSTIGPFFFPFWIFNLSTATCNSQWGLPYRLSSRDNDDLWYLRSSQIIIPRSTGLFHIQSGVEPAVQLRGPLPKSPCSRGIWWVAQQSGPGCTRKLLRMCHIVYSIP